MTHPMAPSGAENNQTPAAVPAGTSQIPAQVPSVIDAEAEGLPPISEEGVETLVGGNTSVEEPTTQVVNETPGQTVEELEATIRLMQEDVDTLNVIRNDPDALNLLNDHFEGRTREPNNGLPVATDGEPNSALEQKVDKLFETVNILAQDTLQRRANEVIQQFAVEHPEVRDQKVAAKMKAVLAEPGSKEMSLDRALAIAKSELGMSGSPQPSGAPLQATETGGAPVIENADQTTALQQRIDGQDSLDGALDIAIREGAKELGF